MSVDGFSVGELAVRFGFEVRGDPDVRVTRVATLQNANAGSLSFLSNPAYRVHLDSTAASAVIVASEFAEQAPCTAIVAADPYVAYARIAALLHPAHNASAGVHASAVVSRDATISESASIAACVVIEPGAIIGERAVIGAGSFIGANSRVGAESLLAPRVTLMDDVHIGARCTLHSGAVIGADGFGIARAPEGWIKVPQAGGVRIGDDVDIGACTSIDRGAIEHTVIGNGVKLDNQIQIGHNVVIGEHTVMAGMVGIAGSTNIGKNCVFGGNAGTTGHLSITDNVVITSRCTVTSDINEAGTYGGVFPHEDFRSYQRNLARYRQLDKLARRVGALEKKQR